MRLFLHIGPDALSTERLQTVLASKRAQLANRGILYPRSPNPMAHTRLYLASTDPDTPDALRTAQGFANPEAQTALRADLVASLKAEIAEVRPDTLILSAHQLGSSLTQRADLERLRDLLRLFSEDIAIIATVDESARMCLRHYTQQLLDGRLRSLALEQKLIAAPDWWRAAQSTRPNAAPERGIFPDAQMSMPWLDLPALVQHWGVVFGRERVQLHSFDRALWSGPDVTEALRKMFDIAPRIGKAGSVAWPGFPPGAWMTRARLFNDALLRLMRAEGRVVPPRLCRQLLGELAVRARPADPGALSALSKKLAPGLAQLAHSHPGLDLAHLRPSPPQPDWQESDPGFGFRATQYLAASLPRIEETWGKDRPKVALPPLSETATRLMPPLARTKMASLIDTPFAPQPDSTPDAGPSPAYPTAPHRIKPHGSMGRVIIACMKTEAPYIVDWIAHHRAIGIDSFLIYTNDCEDTTDPLLQRLEALGVVHHRSNAGWQGNSPQQHALDLALSDPVVQAADWIGHIDVDEYINIHCGTGTFDDLLRRCPQATHFAMTWRLFGNAGVQGIPDAPVPESFTACAPRHLPKPHTAWGFKTFGRNTGAYDRLSCHRPNGLRPGAEVFWANGSGTDITDQVRKNGWRSNKRTIGYDLVQLNHYALRSLDSFLVKRARGRALHVDRDIGRNYWLRMNWGNEVDTTMLRNAERTRLERAQLMQDPEVARLHTEGLAWHRQKAAALRALPDTQALIADLQDDGLSALERAALALAADVDS